MAEAGERKRKLGIDIDFDKLLARDDEPPPELVIHDAPNKSMPTDDGEVADPPFENSLKKCTQNELMEKIKRHRTFLRNCPLPDGGEKLRANLGRLEAEMMRRKSQQDEDNKRSKVIELADESTRNGLTNDVSQPRAPPSKPASEFGIRLCSSLNISERENKSFKEELSTLNPSNLMKTRDRRPFSNQITQKKCSSSRLAPFKSPSHLSVDIDNQQQNNREQRGSHDFNRSSHLSDRDASCGSTKKAIDAYNLRSLNSRRSNRKTVVLVDEEELEVDVVDKIDLVGQSSIDARIYYPSRDDPKAIEICFSDMECLSPQSYLSSPIMNFYIRYLQKPTSPSARTERDFHIFNTYFYEKLKQDVLNKTQRETLFVKFRRWWKGVNIFEKAYIFLPIHENQHWSLVIICMPNKEDESGPIMLHLDSFGVHISKSIFNNVKRQFTENPANYVQHTAYDVLLKTNYAINSFLIEEWKCSKGLPELPIAENIWKNLPERITEKVIQVPQQENGYDCGLFVLFFMERFIDEAPERLKRQDLEHQFGRQWFRPEEASDLRRKIHNLLKNEFRNANEEACKLDS